MDNDLIQNKIELRTLQESVMNGKITAEDAKAKLAELSAKRADIEKRIALAKAPIIKEETASNYKEIAQAMREKRAISLNGTGAINQVNELVKELTKKTPLLEMVKKFVGRDAATNIPLFSPTLGVPAAYAEGATSVTADATAALNNRSLTPHAFVSLLPVTAEALNLGVVNFEAELPSIFADAFAQGFHQQILTGAGTGLNFRGIFTVAAANTAFIEKDASLMAIRELALRLQDYNDNGEAVIIMNPAIYSLIMSDSAVTNGEDLYKEELIRSRTIEGVKVILTSGAPSSTASGACYAVGGNLHRNYGLALASELSIEPIKKVGDTNTYFQSVIFANGSPLIDKEFIPLLME
jgi:HK97 family phage major capsid protein